MNAYPKKFMNFDFPNQNLIKIINKKTYYTNYLMNKLGLYYSLIRTFFSK